MTSSWRLLIVVGICWQCSRYANAASTLTGRFPRRLQQNSGYLPPFSNSNYADIYSTNMEPFRTSPRVSSKTISPTTSAHQFKAYSSYAAPASGAATFQYSAPQASNKIPLPALIPKSVFEQLSMSMTQYQQQQPEVPTGSQSAAAPVLVVEEPSMLLTPNQNKTLQAARFLASTLLEANGEAALELDQLSGGGGRGVSDASDKFNSTDVVIVKSQKNAYIIPTQLAKGASRSQMDVREIYQMRDQLDKAYTINQFIFIIKPEKINFLNKLV